MGNSFEMKATKHITDSCKTAVARKKRKGQTCRNYYIT